MCVWEGRGGEGGGLDNIGYTKKNAVDKGLDFEKEKGEGEGRNV